MCVNMTLTLHTDYCKLTEMEVSDLLKTVRVTVKAVEKIGKRNHK